MRQVMIIANSICLFCCFYWQLAAIAAPQWESLDLPNTAKDKLEKGETYLLSHVETLNKTNEQQFDFVLAARHSKSCRFALKKLKLYERFSEYVDMVTLSRYTPETRELYLELSPPIISDKLILTFNIARIESEGSYPFRFDGGFLNGLEGKIEVLNYKHRCIFSITAHWKGAKTRYSDQVLSLFAATASEIALNRLFRISSSY